MKVEFKRNKTIKDFSDFVSRYKTRYYSRLGVEIVMDKREGVYFWDLSGKRYINCHSNGGVFNLGHRNQAVAHALLEAIEDYDIGNHHLISGPRALLARRLTESFSGGLVGGIWEEKIDTVVYGVSGGEAIDFAIKLARGYTGKQKIISLEGGYHGHTGLALSAGDEKYRIPFGVNLQGFQQVPFGNWNELEAAIDEHTAAILIETIPATLGMRMIPREVMQKIRKLCSKRNVLLIMDEIQTGMGRTGKAWGFQHYGIVPDVVVTGKGLSGGFYPIAATCFRKKFEKVFRKDPFRHISTFGGSELGCFAALKSIELSCDLRFLDQVSRRGEYFRQSFQTLVEEYEELVEFRGLGMFMGLVFVDEPTCLAFIKVLYENGVYAVYANNDKRVMQFLPPLITTEQEAEEILSLVKKSLRDLKKLKFKLIKKALEFML